MRPFFKLALAVGLCLCLLPTVAWATLSGDGDQNSPYLVTSAEDFKELASGTSGKYYELTTNIIVTEGIANFEGHFDGKGNTITLNINGSGNQGVFTSLRNDGFVENLKVTGTVTSTGNHVGGVVGLLNSGCTVQNCANIGAAIRGNAEVGGVVGYNAGGTVQNCYNLGGAVTALGGGSDEDHATGGSVGGVVGNNTGTVQNCYNTGSASGATPGGVVGTGNSVVAETCYFSSDTLNHNLGSIRMDSTRFRSGEVAWRLQKGAGDGVWGQRLPSADTNPVLHPLANYGGNDYENVYKVYQITYVYFESDGAGGSRQKDETTYLNADDGASVKEVKTLNDLYSNYETEKGQNSSNDLGWFTDVDGSRPFSGTIDGDLTLYAKDPLEQNTLEEPPAPPPPGDPLPAPPNDPPSPPNDPSPSLPEDATINDDPSSDDKDSDGENQRALEAARKNLEAANAGDDSKVKSYADSNGRLIPAVTVKLYKIGASIPVPIMRMVAEGSTALMVDLDNGAAQLLIPPGFSMTDDPRRVYYPVGRWQSSYYTDLIQARIRGTGVRTEIHHLGGGTLPTAATVTLKSGLSGSFSVYHWDDATRKITFLTTGNAQDGKAVFATKQLGTLILTTGTI